MGFPAAGHDEDAATAPEDHLPTDCGGDIENAR